MALKIWEILRKGTKKKSQKWLTIRDGGSNNFCITKRGYNRDILYHGTIFY
jgi:hypothetical protein